MFILDNYIYKLHPFIMQLQVRELYKDEGNSNILLLISALKVMGLYLGISNNHWHLYTCMLDDQYGNFDPCHSS